MKTLSEYNKIDNLEYITEVNVQSWFKQFVTKITNTLKKMQAAGLKQQAEQMDVKKLSTPEEGIPYNKRFDTILNDKIAGFPMLAQMLKSPKKFMIYGKDAQNVLKPKYQWYIYQKDNNTANSMFAAVITYDDTIHYLQDKSDLVILNVETSGLCGNEEEVINFCWKGFTDTWKKDHADNKNLCYSFFDRKQVQVTSKMAGKLNFKKDASNPLLFVCKNVV